MCVFFFCFFLSLRLLYGVVEPHLTAPRNPLARPLSADARVTGRRSAGYITEFFNVVGKARDSSLLPNSRFMEMRYVVVGTHMHIPPYVHLFIHTVCARCVGLIWLLSELHGEPCGVFTSTPHRRFRLWICVCPLSFISH